MENNEEQHIAPQYSDSIHTGDVIGQKIMQQNIHHESNNQQVLQPCMGCSSRNYLKPVPCSAINCKIVCCDLCVKYQGWSNTSPVCDNHFKTATYLGARTAIIALGAGLAFVGILIEFG